MSGTNETALQQAGLLPMAVLTPPSEVSERVLGLETSPSRAFLKYRPLLPAVQQDFSTVACVSRSLRVGLRGTKINLC